MVAWCVVLWSDVRGKYKWWTAVRIGQHWSSFFKFM